MSTAPGTLRNIALRRKAETPSAPGAPATVDGHATRGQVAVKRSDAVVALRTLGLIYWRNVRQMPRMPAVMVFGILMPIIQLVLFGSIFTALGEFPGVLPPGVTYIAFIAPAIVLLTGVMGMANMSASLLVDLRSGYFDKLRTTPATPWAIVVARMAADMTRVMGQAFLVLVVALLMGASVATGLLGAIVMVFLAVLFSACTVGLLVSALAMKTKSDQATQSFFPLFFLALFLTSAYMPRNFLPDWLQTVASINPLEFLIRSLRELMITGWPLQDIGIVIGASIAGVVLFGWLNVRVYRNMAG